MSIEEQLEQEIENLHKLLEFDSFLQSLTTSTLIIDTILVTVTAGIGFSFNRAFLLLIDEKSNFLKGISAIGPADIEEANKIYENIEAQNLSLAELIQLHHRERETSDKKVNELVKKIYINHSKDPFFINLFKEKRVLQVQTEELNPDSYITNLLMNNKLIFVPLIDDDRPIGVLIVDNFITNNIVADKTLELLQLYANRSASALRRAQLHDLLTKEIKRTKKAKLKVTEMNNLLMQTEKLAAIGEVMSEIAHEIRNPLVSIGGFAKILLRQLKKDDKHYDMIKIIAEESTRLENILANVLDYARINRLEKQVLPICKAVEQAIKLLEYKKEEKNLTINLFLTSKDASVEYDFEKFIQIFFNLIKNAMQASYKDDKIDITVKQVKEKVIVSIKDYGTGIKSENLENIFNPFFTTKKKGIGLGLSIVKQIITNHGGTIHFITEEDVGTEFIITLNHKKK